MKPTVFFVFLLYFFGQGIATEGMAQTTFQRQYGNTDITVFTDMATTHDGGYITSGYWTPSQSITPVQPLLTHLDSEGNIIWAKEFANPGIGRATSITSTSDSGFVVVGKLDTLLGTGGSDDGFLLKTDAAGTVQWMKIVGSGLDDEVLNRVVEAPNGDLIAVGSWTASANGNEYFWFLRCSSTGTVLQSFSYFPEVNAEANAVVPLPDGGTLIAGTGRVNFIDEAILFKISPMGVLEWYTSYGAFGGSEVIHDLILLEDNSIVFTGTRHQADRELFIGKTDSVGQLIWMKDYGTAEDLNGHRIRKDPAGGYIIAGHTQNQGAENGPLLMKTDDNGNVLWTHVLDGVALPTGAMGLVAVPDGGWGIAGTVLPDQGTAVGLAATLKSDGEGCNITTLTAQSRMVTTTVDTPTVYATQASSASFSFIPEVTNVVIPDSVICLQVGTAESLAYALKVYPNPVSRQSQEIHIKTDPAFLPATLSVLNLMGETVYAQQVMQIHQTIQVEDWDCGIYFLRLENRLGNTVRKILITP